MAGLSGFGADEDPDVFVFRPGSFEQDLGFALGRAGDAGLLQDIRSGRLSEDERAQLLSGLFDLPKNTNITADEFFKTVKDLRLKFENFQRPRVEQQQAVDEFQKNVADRPGLRQVRQSLLTGGGGRIVPGAGGGSIVTGAV